MVNRLIQYISVFLALLLVLPIHEFAHAFVAVKSGDNTPKIYGRYTLNPMAHFDVLGLVCLLFVHFGWAKPVPVNPNNFKHPKLDSFLVAIAGVTANYLLAFIVYPILVIDVLYVPEFYYFTEVLYYSLYYAFFISLALAVFNFLPIYPLDGFRVVDVFVRRRGKVYYIYKKYGYFVLLAFILLGIIADYADLPEIDLLGRAITYLVNMISIPITSFWGLIFNGRV